MSASDDIKYCPVCDDTFSSYEDMLSIIKKQMCCFCWRETSADQKRKDLAQIKKRKSEGADPEESQEGQIITMAPTGRKSWEIPRYKIHAPYQHGIKRGKELEKKRLVYLIEHYDEEAIGLPFTQENVVVYLSSLP